MNDTKEGTTTLNIYALTAQEAFERLGSGPEGLTTREATRRLEEKGPNALPRQHDRGILAIAFAQFTDPFILILLAAGVISLVLSAVVDAAIIFAAVLINGVIGFFQEYKVSEIIKRLKSQLRHAAVVVRDGQMRTVDSAQVVVGDVVILRQGDRIPADARVIKESDLRTNEVPLTGESMPVEKVPEPVDDDTPVSDRANMVYSGTLVEAGTGRVLITATGTHTEIGRIAALVLRERGKDITPLQRKFRKLAKVLGLVFVGLSILLFAIGIIVGLDPLMMFLTAVAVAVAAVPESLPIAVSVVLAVGARRILEKGGLVRKMSAAEALGSVEVIATDKTATLTEGRMSVVRFVLPDGTEVEREAMGQDDAEVAELFRFLLLSSDAFVENPEASERERRISGSPIDKAILMLGLNEGRNRKELEEQFPRLDGIPFSAALKYSAVLNRVRDRSVLSVLGAPEVILAASSMDEAVAERMGAKTEALASQGLRMLALATKELSEGTEKAEQDAIGDLRFRGLVVFSDPIRSDVIEAVRQSQEAGNRLVIVTGDHIKTAEYIGRQVGILQGHGRVIEGRNLPEDLALVVERYDVFARVSPEDKVRIVEAFQSNGKRIAMIGDGVNDAPALLRADIGVAVGSGTDVAKDASDLVLLNDSFRIIVEAIRQGRILFANILKVTLFLLSSAFSEILLIMGSLLAGLPLALLPGQILWVNIIVDGLPAISLAFDRQGTAVSAASARHRLDLSSPRLWAMILLFSVITDGALFALFAWLISNGSAVDYARTMAFGGIGITALLYVFSVRVLDRPVWKANPFSNPALVFAVAAGFILYGVALYVPRVAELLQTVPLNGNDWFLLLTLGLFNVAMFEFVKRLFLNGRQRLKAQYAGEYGGA